MNLTSQQKFYLSFIAENEGMLLPAGPPEIAQLQKLELIECALRLVDDLGGPTSDLNRCAWRLTKQGLALSKQTTGKLPLDVVETLTRCAQILDVIKGEWSETGAWTEWDQNVRDGITRALALHYGEKQ